MFLIRDSTAMGADDDGGGHAPNVSSSTSAAKESNIDAIECTPRHRRVARHAERRSGQTCHVSRS